MNLIIVGSDWSIPTTMRNYIHILDLPLPIGEELYQNIFKLAVTKYNLAENRAKDLAEKAQGMNFQAVAQTAKLITTKNLWQQPEEASKLLLEVKNKKLKNRHLRLLRTTRRRTPRSWWFRKHQNLGQRTLSLV